jgi:hypothetical protein
MSLDLAVETGFPCDQVSSVHGIEETFWPDLDCLGQIFDMCHGISRSYLGTTA